MPYVTAQQGSAIWTLVSPNGYRAVFNNPSDVDYIGALTGDEAVTGLDSPEVRSAVFDRVEADGALFGNFYHGHRPVTLSAEVVAATVADRNQRENKLYKVLNDCMRFSGTLTWTPSGSVSQFVYVRKFQPTRVRGGFKKDIFVSLLAADPYIYSTTLNTASMASTTNTIITNEGNAAREPQFLRVNGPTGGNLGRLLRTTNAVTQEIRLVGAPAMASGEYIDIDPINRTVRHSSGADYYRYIDYAWTIWWQLQPGNNTVSLRGFDTQGTMRIDWRHAWV